MAEDSEKRFHTVMDKLFHSPRSTPRASSSSSSSSGMQSFRGKKRPNPTSALAMLDPRTGLDSSEEAQPSAGIPLCRPWDRGDLMRRLSTFKSMTWFAKPKAVSAVNCARRGWVNVDTDTIACEACGARILFSTSSSWSREQVEKAALVVSLKLDNGHKSLCPWIDNTCDETLAHFPPTPPLVLADQFRERSSILSHLLSLPVVSSSAIEFMRSPQLDKFLQQSSFLEYGDASPGSPFMESLENGCDGSFADLYYQALKLISLCGWEPRILPYVVEHKMDLSNQTAEEANVANSSKVLREREKSIVCIPSSDLSPMLETNRNFGGSSESVADPKSVVLDCKLCGASVGLWTFFTVTQPVEVFRLVGLTGINNEKNGSRQDTVNGNRGDRSLGFEPKSPSSNKNLTIAGGPSPTQQNFKATISLPVIGRSIRARFSSDPYLRNYLAVCQENRQSGLGIEAASLVGEESNKASGNTSGNQAPPLSDTPAEGSGSHRKDDEHLVLMEGTVGTFSSHLNNIRGEANGPNEAEGLSQNDARGDLGNSNGKTSSVVIASDQAVDKNTYEVAIECSRILFPDSSASEEPPVLHGINSSMAGTSSDAQKSLVSQENVSREYIVEETTSGSSKKELRDGSVGKHISLGAADKGMEFDPIRQHRHFCPWIASTGGVVPGWQQVLPALQRRKEASHLSPTSPPSASLIKVNDPITSVRRLFTSKRMKHSQGTS